MARDDDWIYIPLAAEVNPCITIHIMFELTQNDARIIVNALHCLLQRDGLNAPDRITGIAEYFSAGIARAEEAKEKATTEESSAVQMEAEAEVQVASAADTHTK